jgi:hypothetical protein
MAIMAIMARYFEMKKHRKNNNVKNMLFPC